MAGFSGESVTLHNKCRKYLKDYSEVEYFHAQITHCVIRLTRTLDEAAVFDGVSARRATLCYWRASAGAPLKNQRRGRGRGKRGTPLHSANRNSVRKLLGE